MVAKEASIDNTQFISAERSTEEDSYSSVSESNNESECECGLSMVAEIINNVINNVCESDAEVDSDDEDVPLYFMGTENYEVVETETAPWDWYMRDQQETILHESVMELMTEDGVVYNKKLIVAECGGRFIERLVDMPVHSLALVPYAELSHTEQMTHNELLEHALSNTEIDRALIAPQLSVDETDNVTIVMFKTGGIECDEHTQTLQLYLINPSVEIIDEDTAIINGAKFIMIRDSESFIAHYKHKEYLKSIEMIE